MKGRTVVVGDLVRGVGVAGQHHGGPELAPPVIRSSNAELVHVRWRTLAHHGDLLEDAGREEALSGVPRISVRKA